MATYSDFHKTLHWLSVPNNTVGYTDVALDTKDEKIESLTL